MRPFAVNRYFVVMKTRKRIALFIFMLLLTSALMGFSASGASLNRKKVTLKKGATIRLTVKGTSKSVKWSSSRKKVASVSKSGKVTAKKAGKATITAKFGKKKLKCVVTVKNRLMSAREKAVYKKLISYKKKYPSGKKFDNSVRYVCKPDGLPWTTGYGCAAFAFELSDAAFGSSPSKTHKKRSAIMTGDILCMDNEKHYVIVLKNTGREIIVAEGNYGGKVKWGRHITMSTLKKEMVYVLTRYAS